ncbi:MAG: diguanylate cyclase [Nitriliruptorales bacterium]|nr:diguanylate cyclase [Nitriliruptorales bacterium]
MGDEPDESAADDRHIGGATTGALIAYVRRTSGDEALARVLAAAGETRSAEHLSDTTTWSSYPRAVALLKAAADVTGEVDVARSAGEELLRQYADTEVAALLRSLGSPVEVLRNVTATGGKYSTVTEMDAVDVADGRVVIAARSKPGFTRDPRFCAYTAGVLSQATPLFGLPPASVTEVECQTRGNEYCLYEVTWDPDAAADDDVARKCAHLESELQALTNRFEALQANASELVTASTVDDLLRTVARRVGLAVRAPRHLLAVRLSPTEPIRVHYNGFPSDDAAQAAAEHLLADSAADDSGSRLVVDVATPRSSFGRIAALHDDGARFFTQERRLLEAYAGHVAAALETAAALEQARRENMTARALLHLARELSGLGRPEDVAARVITAMSAVVDCDQKSVLLWDAEQGVLELAASAGMSEETQRFMEALAISPVDTAALETILRTRAPMFLTRETVDDFLAPLFERAGVESVAVVPITAGSEFFGVITAGFVDSEALRGGDVDLIERLAGLADHAATALQNSYLLERVHAQSLHDSLTGLPNARFLEDRVTSALAHARRDGSKLALLFIDFDEFKPVNDVYGHAAGDKVLIEAAGRMRAVLRSGDTVARLAGDEFVIVLPGLATSQDADAVADKLSASLQLPYSIGDETVAISGSIGIAMFPDVADEYHTLVRAADTAMYQAKRRRRATYGYGHSA